MKVDAPIRVENIKNPTPDSLIFLIIAVVSLVTCGIKNNANSVRKELIKTTNQYLLPLYIFKVFKEIIATGKKTIKKKIDSLKIFKNDRGLSFKEDSTSIFGALFIILSAPPLYLHLYKYLKIVHNQCYL